MARFIKVSWPSLLTLAMGLYFLARFGDDGNMGGAFGGVSYDYQGVFFAGVILSVLGVLMTIRQVFVMWVREGHNSRQKPKTRKRE